jgi:chromosomal replication initiator protein
MTPQIRDIQWAAATHFGIPLREMQSETRRNARPRQVAMFLARRMTPKSYPQIGRHFGGRDHSTVIHAERRVDDLRHADPIFASAITAIGRDAARIASQRKRDA